ncbi:hypothetical protein BTJ39_11710 [Izhakiella australiensis]|uniref:Glycosyltransferase 2-like domain-containing protein n=1 Tax=Izhakiella australiensis TaxID=1926881 RepID=A0A1S8YKS4_9GAMM|nr:glycosyltransferase family 2 protein [Izhakiella australiensis]OON39699.1 hypothetical protein BTJ39_11710 [Izhakiella australiensis]
MTNQLGTVGIIIPMYNAKETILRAIHSVLNQTWQDWHIYLINDKSTDNSLALVREHCTDPRITILDNPVNLGAAETRNVGLEASNESFIAFLDSDDEWEKNKLTLQMQALASGDDLSISHYHYRSRTKSYDVRWARTHLTKDEFVKKRFRVCFSSVCYRRPPRDVRFHKKGHEDFLFLYELFEQYQQARVVAQNLVNYYELGDSLSRNKNKAARWHLDLLRFIYKNNPLKVYYYYLWYMVNGVLFTLKHR